MKARLLTWLEFTLWVAFPLLALGTLFGLAFGTQLLFSYLKAPTWLIQFSVPMTPIAVVIWLNFFRFRCSRG